MSNGYEHHQGDPVNDKYILEDREVVACNDLLKWGAWFENTEDRRVARTHLRNRFEETMHISTVFLGLDHNFGSEGPPLVFETMAFGGPDDGDQRRCSTWDEAEAQHVEMLQHYLKNGWSIDA